MQPVKINIEVAYATPASQIILVVQLDENTSILDAINRSGILDLFPEIDLTKQSVGIFSCPKELTDTVQQGERIEIYRPLLVDPKEARKLRARS